MRSLTPFFFARRCGPLPARGTAASWGPCASLFAGELEDLIDRLAARIRLVAIRDRDHQRAARLRGAGRIADPLQAGILRGLRLAGRRVRAHEHFDLPDGARGAVFTDRALRGAERRRIEPALFPRVDHGIARTGTGRCVVTLPARRDDEREYEHTHQCLP